jgi:hypothetical protein
MSDILFQYEKVNPTSWAYLSSLLTLALFFKFNRVLSLRNLDLFFLILVVPGLLLVEWSFQKEYDGTMLAMALRMQRIGFLWLFAAHAVIMLRLLLDSAVMRRPLLDPNLNAAGLAFLGSSLLFFQMANVVTGKVDRADWTPALSAEEIQEQQEGGDTFDTEGPGYWLLYLMPRITTQKLVAEGSAAPGTEQEQKAQQQEVRVITARVMAIISHVLIVTGLVITGARHFDNPALGLAAATLYLLYPYTAMRSGDVSHALPGALLTWAIVLYRRPLAAGMFIGLASGTIYYPIFLLPLWCSFYWERGLRRFLAGVFATIGALVTTIAFTAGDFENFKHHLSQMFGIRLPRVENLQGIWRAAEGFWNSWYRLPILAAFVLLAISFAAWPVRKHLGTLISYTAALMVGAQFWHAHGGGIYVAWYLPLYLMATFRPNLSERIATTMVSEGWWKARERTRAAAVEAGAAS